MATLISLVIPIFNERESLPPLLALIASSLKSHPHEIILVDDGSTDGSDQIIIRYAKENPHIRAILFRRNFGQTAALAAGFKEAAGDVIIPLDADGQNDPADIPALLAKLDEGYDVVSGWRHPRRDPVWTRQLPSILANALIAKITGVPLHDFGCTLKAYRRFTLDNTHLYGEMHRFLPAWCAWRGARIAEIKVHHRSREKGQSKYGITRTFKVLLDLLTTKFMSGYFSKPNYFFGGLALILYVLATLSGVIVFYDKFGPDRWPAFRIPLLLLTIFFGIVGTLLLLMGLLAELIVRLFYEVASERPYQIRQIVKAPVSTSGDVGHRRGPSDRRSSFSPPIAETVNRIPKD